MPIEQLRQERKHGLGHVCAILLLDVIEQTNDVAALDLADLTTAKHRERQPAQDALAFVSRSQLHPFAPEVVLSHSLKSGADGGLSLALVAQRIAALGYGTQDCFRLSTGFLKAQAGLQRHTARYWTT